MGIVADAEHEIEHIITDLETEGHAVSGRLRAAWDALRADVPTLERAAEVDAEQVVKDATTEGVIPAEQAAVVDAGELAVEAAGDVAKAAETPAAPSA